MPRSPFSILGLFSLALLMTHAVPAASAAPASSRAEVIIPRQAHPWQSQQVQEPCILPNPKDPTRLVMFYSGVPAANRRTCYIGKAWALKSDPLTWHADPENPVMVPAPGTWESL